MNRYEGLSNEQKLLLLTSRLTFSEADEVELLEVLKNKLDWFYILNTAIKNKVLPLMWNNLSKRYCQYYMPNRIEQISRYYYLGNRECNTIYLNELKKVLNNTTAKGIPCIPLKGAFLIPNMYKDFGIRLVGDIDCLIKKSDIRRIRSAMNEIGYFEGDYDYKDKKIKQISREEDILWKMKMNNLYPFKKICNSEYVDFTEFDFSFSLDLDLNIEAVETMVNRSSIRKSDTYKSLKICDFFVQLCCHLYKEASNAMWVALGKDLNLIKFCDVREFVINFMDDAAKNEAVEFALKYGFQKALYFTVFYLREIYCDGYETELIDSLNVKDTDFLNSFGKKDFGENIAWKKSFWQRLFAETNEDELMIEPKYVNVNEHYIKDVK
jgi:hypothetical protein